MSYNTVQGIVCDPNVDSDLAGYKFYAGSASRVYDGTKTVTSTSPAATFTGLDNGLTWYFSATAYDTAGNESTFGAELSKLITVSVLQLVRRVL